LLLVGLPSHTAKRTLESFQVSLRDSERPDNSLVAIDPCLRIWPRKEVRLHSGTGLLLNHPHCPFWIAAKNRLTGQDRLFGGRLRRKPDHFVR